MSDNIKAPMKGISATTVYLQVQEMQRQVDMIQARVDALEAPSILRPAPPLPTCQSCDSRPATLKLGEADVCGGCYARGMGVAVRIQRGRRG